MNMTFQELLNSYIEEIPCTAKELAKNSDISETTISRYRKGERIPSSDSENLKRLASGIVLTGTQKGRNDMDAEKILRDLQATLPQEEKSLLYFKKFDLLLRELEVNVSQMAVALHYDSSYISKVRAGKRSPSDPGAFVEKICGYLARNFSGEEEISKVASLTGCTQEQLKQPQEYLQTLKGWLCQADTEKPDYISGFLHKMDSFDLDDYIRAIHFDSFKIPKVPFQMPVSR